MHISCACIYCMWYILKINDTFLITLDLILESLWCVSLKAKQPPHSDKLHYVCCCLNRWATVWWMGFPIHRPTGSQSPVDSALEEMDIYLYTQCYQMEIWARLVWSWLNVCGVSVCQCISSQKRNKWKVPKVPLWKVTASVVSRYLAWRRWKDEGEVPPLFFF